MLILNPSRASFAGAPWDDVTAVVIDRVAGKTVLEWSDAGPYAVLADVPEQKVTFKVERQLLRDGLDGPRPGDSGELSFYAAPSASEAGRVRVRATCVVLGVTHELLGKRGAVRTVELAAVSSDGAADPVLVSPAEAES